jgi:hypothetical protein
MPKSDIPYQEPQNPGHRKSHPSHSLSPIYYPLHLTPYSLSLFIKPHLILSLSLCLIVSLSALSLFPQSHATPHLFLCPHSFPPVFLSDLADAVLSCRTSPSFSRFDRDFTALSQSPLCSSLSFSLAGRLSPHQQPTITLFLFFFSRAITSHAAASPPYDG